MRAQSLTPPVGTQMDLREDPRSGWIRHPCWRHESDPNCRVKTCWGLRPCEDADWPIARGCEIAPGSHVNASMRWEDFSGYFRLLLSDPRGPTPALAGRMPCSSGQVEERSLPAGPGPRLLARYLPVPRVGSNDISQLATPSGDGLVAPCRVVAGKACPQMK